MAGPFSRTPGTDWQHYLRQFHRERVGAIEELLQRADDHDATPYDWLGRAVSPHSTTVLDLACGTGAVGRHLQQLGRTIIGVDMSANELDEARRRDPSGTFVRGDARRLPIQDSSVDAVVSCYGFAVIRPLPQVVAEIARVLTPGGVVVILTPAVNTVRPGDIPAVSRLLSVLRSTPRFPSDERLELPSLFGEHGIHKVEDARQRYTYTIRSREDAERLLTATYMPGMAAARMTTIIDSLTASARRRPLRVPIPMRRFVGIK